MPPDPDPNANPNANLGGPSVDDAIARLIGGDPLATDLIRSAALAYADRVEIHAALALVADDPVPGLARALELATTRHDRQHVAIIDAHLTGTAERTRILARQHLAEFPDDVVISWLLRRS